jgi:hypothetical protein
VSGGKVRADADDLCLVVTAAADDQRERLARIGVVAEAPDEVFRGARRPEKAQAPGIRRELVEEAPHGVAVGRDGRTNAGRRAVAEHES